MVIITRSDLTPGYQAQQSIHTAFDFAYAFRNHLDHWKENTNGSDVALSVPNQAVLTKWYEKLSQFTDVTIFYEPDNDIQYSSIALYATPEIRKKLSSLPLLGKPPKISYQSVIQKMMDTPQTDSQSVLEHGMSVYKYFQNLFSILVDGGDEQQNAGWKLPEWLMENRKFILDNLHSADDIREYQLMHDCGKPYCLEIDSEGKRHFPDHANVSANIFTQISDNRIVADLIRNDMTLHIIKADEVPTFVENNSLQTVLTLLVTSLCELHSNASMFGKEGVESTSFKIKYKQLDKRGKQIMKIFQEQEIAA